MGRKIEVENLNLFKTVLASSMSLNPIPPEPGPHPPIDTPLSSFLFYLITVLATMFIVGVVLTRKYSRYRKLVGKIFTATGILEIVAFILYIIIAQYYTSYFISSRPQFNSLIILGIITLAGGIASTELKKPHWGLFFLIMVAIIVIAWSYISWTYGFGLM